METTAQTQTSERMPIARPPSSRPPPAIPTVLGSRIATLLRAVETSGTDPEVVRRHAGVGALPAPTVRVSEDVQLAVWRSAMQICRDASMPIRYARQSRLSDYGVLGLACKTAPSLSKAFQRLSRYGRLLDDGLACRLELRGQRAYAILDRDADVERDLARRVATEAELAELWQGALSITATRPDLVEARFAHSAPRDVSAHREHFGCAVTFDAGEDALVFRSGLMIPLAKSDEGISHYLLAELEKLAPPSSWRECVEIEIERRLPKGPPTVQDVARALAVGKRTLQRHLSTEGTSFQGVLTDVRTRIAKRLLVAGRHSVTEVAYLLGFSEPSAFHRAFRRWTGRTPATYRADA